MVTQAELDPEEPPSLVVTDGAQSTGDDTGLTEATKKVPITIVTGVKCQIRKSVRSQALISVS